MVFTVPLFFVQAYAYLIPLFCTNFKYYPYLAHIIFQLFYMERTPDKFARLVTYVVIAIALGAMCLGVMSCNPSNRATTKFYKAVKLDRVTTGNNCYDVFPTKDSTIIKTEYKQGETIRDTFTEVQVEVMNDTVYLTKTIRSFRVDTAYLNVTKSIENTAKIDYLREVNGKNIARGDRFKAKYQNWQSWALIGWGIVALFASWQLFKLWRKATVRI